MSFGHSIRSATAAECDFYNSERRWGEGSQYVSRPVRCWACHEPVSLAVEYRYVTGRQGRVTSSTRFVCEKHGRTFAAKHKLTVPEAEP